MSEDQRLHNSIEHVHGPEEVTYGKEEFVVVCLVRDGRPYVKAFVEHYRALGARHIAFLDNGSTDGTVEALQDYEGVTVLRTRLPYKLEGAPLENDPIGNGWTRECLFKQYLYARFGGRDRWCLCADIDELFDYPYSDVIGLGSFLAYLNEGRYTAVAAQMIDMFPEEPLLGTATSVDEPLKESHRFCDLSNLKRRRMINTEALISRNTTVASKEVEFFGLGIRDTVFGTKPHLTKFPLVFLDGETKPMDRSVHKVSNARVADITCALFHYKFVDAHLHEQVAHAVRDEHRIWNSAKYKMYQRVLEENPTLQLKRESAIEVTSVNDLLDNAVLVISDEYVSWANSEEEKTVMKRTGRESSELVGAYLEARRRDRAKTLSLQRLDHRLRRVRKRRLRQNRQLREQTSLPEKRQPSVEVRPSTDQFPKGSRPLFVGGPARSGTTAFADYLNRHEAVLLCEERYKGRQNRVSWDLFNFDRIMDFSRPEEIKRPPLAQTREQFIERHAELLSNKDPSKLKWLGDKGPFYVRSMDRLASNNPGARFIMLYRSIEEVAESWDSRAKDPADPWRSERGVEMSVGVWNAAMRGMRDFVEMSPAPRLLIVSYHDFFYRSEAVVPQLSRFLGLDFDDSLTGNWRWASHEFEGRRRRKDILSEEQKAFIQQHADREAEAWVLDRIERQWQEPALYAEESDEAALASLDEIEARMWSLQQRAEKLETELKRKQDSGSQNGKLRQIKREHAQTLREKNRSLQDQLRQVRSQKNRQVARLSERNRDLQHQLEAVHSSRTWRALRLISRLKTRIMGKG